MSENSNDQCDLYDSPVARWIPSPALRGRLLLGAVAALAFGGLAALASLAERGQGQAGPMSPARAFGVASLIPLAGVLWTYLGVGREVDSFSLRKSAWCALGVMFLWELLGFSENNPLAPWWDAVILIAIAAGLAGFLILAFYSPSDAEPADKNKGSVGPKGAKAGWGGLGIVLVVLAKIGVKFLILFGIKGAGWELMVLLFLIACTVGFFLRFAVCKIQLRGKLGGFAAFVGVAQILGMIGAGIFIAYVLIATREAMQQPGTDEKALEALEDYWKNLAIWMVAGANLAWALLTALLFLTLWTRHDPESDWLRDLQNAENAD
jgi:hypothetical protein